MAYDFNGLDQWMQIDSAVVSSAPITFAAWVYLDATGVETVIAVETGTSTKTGFALVVVSGKLWAITQTGFNDYWRAQSTTSVATGSWNHLAAVYGSSSSRKCYINGVLEATETTNATPNSAILARTTIAQRANTADDQDLDGRIADAAIWNAALTDAEIVSLYRGFNPQRIRPQSLQMNVRMVRNILDTKNGASITNVGTATVTAHPRVY